MKMASRQAGALIRLDSLVPGHYQSCGARGVGRRIVFRTTQGTHIRSIASAILHVSLLYIQCEDQLAVNTTASQ